MFSIACFYPYHFWDQSNPGFWPRGGGEDVTPNPGFWPRGGGEDVTVTLELSFMEAVRGCAKTLTIQTDLACDACGGTGVPPGTRPETCKHCLGCGMSTCPFCGGAGKIASDFCNSCRGRRVVRGVKTVKLNVMAGVDNGDISKMPRSGGADPECNQLGDLYVTIKVKEDPMFRREGSNIHVDAVLSITQAILGGRIQVPTLTGDVIVKVRPGTQPGQKVVLKRKGIRVANSFSLGDQYIHFNVSMPTHLTQRQRQLIEEFAKEKPGEYDERVAAAA